MTLYPSVWPLPYGITIPSEYSPEHNYAIPRSQTQCWKVVLGDWDQVQMAAVHNSSIGNQTSTIRAWMGADPNGASIIPPLSTVPTNVHLTVLGYTWVFYKAGMDLSQLEPSNVKYVIDPAHIYYFNVQNCENKDNSYYLRFTFKRGDATLEL